MIIEMSSKQMKTRAYLKQLARSAARRLERFGVPIHRIQIRLDGKSTQSGGQLKQCQLSLYGHNNYHLNSRHEGKTLGEAMKAAFNHMEQALRRQHSKQSHRNRQRLVELPLQESIQGMPAEA